MSSYAVFDMTPGFPPPGRRPSCADADPALFFPSGEGMPTVPLEVLRLCAACPILRECREFGIEHVHGDAAHGYWGGLTRGQRLRAWACRRAKLEAAMSEPGWQVVPAVCVHDDGYEHTSTGALPCPIKTSAIAAVRALKEELHDLRADLEAVRPAAPSPDPGTESR